MKRNRRFCFLNLDRAAIMPKPLSTFGPKRLANRLAIDKYLELSGLTGSFPTSNPVFGTNENFILTEFRKSDFGRRVSDRFTQSMSKQIGRSHVIDELRVQFPTAMRLKTFGLYQDLLGVCLFHGNREET